METERALLSCLMHTVSSIPPRQWTEEDRECVRRHLEEALTGSNGGCLSAESRRAARQIYAALLVEVADSDTLLVPQNLLDTSSTSGGVTVQALKPTTTVAKCISYSILCCQGMGAEEPEKEKYDGVAECLSPPSNQTPPTAAVAAAVTTPEPLLPPPFTFSDAVPRLSLPTPPHVQVRVNAVPKKKPCRYSRAELLSMCVPGALMPDLPTEDWTVAIIKSGSPPPSSPQEEEPQVSGLQCNGGSSIVIRMPRGPSKHSLGWGRPRTGSWSGDWRQPTDHHQQQHWREEEGGTRNHQRTQLRRRNSWSNSWRRRAVRRDSWREEEEEEKGLDGEEGAGQGKYLRSMSYGNQPTYWDD